MIMRRIRDIVRGLTGAYLIERRLGELGEAMRGLHQPADLDARLADLASQLAAAEARATDAETRLNKLSSYVMLPGTDYSRYAIPLEYLPSRALQPRWGNTHPVIAPLSDWIGSFDNDYCTVLQEMRKLAPRLAAISHNFDHANLDAAWLGVPFAPFDSAALYTIVRHYKPRLYLEIGSGITTAFAHRALRDHGLNTRIVSIDPQPRAAIDALCDDVIRDGLETCDLTLFDALEPGDIVFLDGSHRVFMNSDVTVFMIDVLPRLKPGVVVHVHDITLPWDYPDMFVNCYWSEAYILAAYLIAARDRVKPILPTAWVCRMPQFATWFDKPPVDLGQFNDAWRGGGSMWFTHIR
jgi:predicted O-methyltransferase YrrM